MSLRLSSVASMRKKKGAKEKVKNEFSWRNVDVKDESLEPFDVILNIEIVQDSKTKVKYSSETKIQQIYDGLCLKLGLNESGKNYFALWEQIYDEENTLRRFS